MHEQQGAISQVEAIAKKCILIVEDDPDTAILLVSAVEQYTPHSPLCVESGVEAVCIARKKTPALLLLDYFLGDINGLELADWLHSINGMEKVPTIIMSAGTLSLEKEQQISARQIIFLRKPFELDELFEKIEVLLTEKGMS